MINREITYERDVSRSYMKIPAMPEESFDEQLLLKKKIAGLLPIEKCYVAGAGQYWYNITGQQALDAYCRINQIGTLFFENLILRFCEQIELLEWNLLDVNCLVADPEMVFVNHSGDVISFIAYPFNTGTLSTELQQLMEYLLTKLDHKDKEAVSSAYQLYEMTLSEGFSISDLKSHILNARMEKVVVEPEKVLAATPKEEKMQESPKIVKEESDYVSKVRHLLDDKWNLLYKNVERVLEKVSLKPHKEQIETVPAIIFPDDKPKEAAQIQIHPTVCIFNHSSEPRGELICDRKGVFPDFQLEKSASILGKNPKAELHIDKDTISLFHARIEYQDGEYYIEDLNSTNGTYINDEPLYYKKKRRLEADDKIRFADVTYHFY